MTKIVDECTLVEVVTVNGVLPPGELGVTLCHEHVLIDLRCVLKIPKLISKMRLVDSPVTIDILADLKQDPHVCRDNLLLSDIDEAIQELMRFKMMGGKSIVDMTTPEIGRDPAALRAIAIATGLNIICGTGWYLENSYPAHVKNGSVEELSEIMVRELTEGIDETGIRAGVIGELGTGLELAENERKVMRAGARAQAKTGAPLTIHTWHPLPSVKEANKYLDIIVKEGVDLSKVYLSHMDQTCADVEYHKSIIEKYGVVLSYDCFGFETPCEGFCPGGTHPSDTERVRAVVELLRAGYEKNLVLAQDVCMKTQRRKYGGYGYAHVLENISRDLKHRGISEKQIGAMLVDNPKRILAW
jgi:phosphotriesterase-related protein